MQAGEALTLLIEDCEARVRLAKELNHPDDPINEKGQEELERKELAIAVCTAMLNSMLPVARYRAFVEVVTQAKKRHIMGNVDAEYTVCATTIAGIQSGLSGVAINDMEIRAVIFEQTATGAIPISHFTGFTKSQNFRVWFKDLPVLETLPTVQ